jgi:hypothetical protein
MTDEWRAEFKEINNELVVPEYRRFCDNFNLPFHFADELPSGSIPPEILHKELRLHQYQHIAIHYYIAGRSATFAASIPVVGNLFHHAVEMLLKSFLLKYHSAPNLKRAFGHKLTKLWSAFKRVANEPALAKFDELVTELGTVEELRYPGKGYAFTISPSKVPRSPASGPAMLGLKHYHVNLEEIDELFAALLTGRVNPKFIRSVLNAEAKSQYGRENQHPFIDMP